MNTKAIVIFKAKHGGELDRCKVMMRDEQYVSLSEVLEAIAGESGDPEGWMLADGDIIEVEIVIA